MSRILLLDAKFSVVPGGLHINSVQSADAGVYICRATITETGEMEERSIELQVHTSRDDFIVYKLLNWTESFQGKGVKGPCPPPPRIMQHHTSV